MTALLDTLLFGATGAVILAAGLASTLARRTFHSVMFLGVVLVAVAGLYVLLGSPLIGVLQILVYVGGILTLFVFAVMFVAGDDAETSEAPRTQRGTWTGPAAAALAAALGLAATYLLVGKVYDAVQALAGGPVASPNLAPTLALVAAAVALLAVVVACIVAWFGLRHILSTWTATQVAAIPVALLILVVMLLGVAGAPGWRSDAAPAADANSLDALTTSLFDGLVLPFELLGVLLTAVMVGALVIARPLGVHGKEESALIHPNLAVPGPGHTDPVAVVPGPSAVAPSAEANP